MRYSARLAPPTHRASVFTGLALNDDFASIDDDISELLLLLGPSETPFLNALAQAPAATVSAVHVWHEQELGPDRIIASTAINSATAATGVQVNGLAHLLQVGMLLELEVPSGNNEITQVTSIPGPNSVLLARNIGVAGTARGVNSLAAGGTLFVISTAEKEGDDTDGDVSRPRTQLTNWTQIFKKALRISGSRQAAGTRPNVGSEFDHQTRLRTRELLRDLEKAVIRSVAMNTIADDNTYRTMNGLRTMLTSINSTVPNNSFVADPLLVVNGLMQQAWNNGARDLDLLLMGSDWSAALSNTNATKIQVEQADRSIRRLAVEVETDFGIMRKLVSPWMPRQAVMGLSTGRIFVPNFQTRGFKSEELAKTGDSLRRHIIGEYTVEMHYESRMFQAHI